MQGINFSRIFFQGEWKVHYVTLLLMSFFPVVVRDVIEVAIFKILSKWCKSTHDPCGKMLQNKFFIFAITFWVNSKKKLRLIKNTEQIIIYDIKGYIWIDVGLSTLIGYFTSQNTCNENLFRRCDLYYCVSSQFFLFWSITFPTTVIRYYWGIQEHSL